MDEADTPPQPSPTATGITRRRALQSATALALGTGAAVGGYRLGAEQGSSPQSKTIPFYGPHQAGIASSQQEHLQFASFNFGGIRASQLRELLKAWSQTAATITAGQPVTAHLRALGPGPADSGETLGLGAASSTVTIGLGRTLFERDGRDRLGLRNRMPQELAPLPQFRGEQLDPLRCGGDLCVQACADDPQVAFHAVRMLARIASAGGTRVRWNQAGFLPAPTGNPTSNPRNLLGFKDGTNNIRGHDRTTMNRHVWVTDGDGPNWMAGGTYLVARRIRIWLDTWDPTSLEEQERVIGRHKASGAPLGGHSEFDPVNLDARAGGLPVIPANAHIRLAAAKLNHGERILRRGYSFSDTVDPHDGQLDAGLFFISFQRSVHHQFVPIQHRLAAHDALNMHTQHTSSALFACPPGPQPDSYVGQALFE
jgi:deferrochelatase/peroxidase EfeB